MGLLETSSDGTVFKIAFIQPSKYLVFFTYILTELEVCIPECHFPGTGNFPKNWEISRLGRLGISSSQSQIIPAIRGLALSRLVLGRESLGNSRAFPE